MRIVKKNNNNKTKLNIKTNMANLLKFIFKKMVFITVQKNKEPILNKTSTNKKAITKKNALFNIT